MVVSDCYLSAYLSLGAYLVMDWDQSVNHNLSNTCLENTCAGKKSK